MKKIKITLTDDRPLLVSNTSWPLVSRAAKTKNGNNQELTRRYYLRVRMHAARLPDGVASDLEWYGADEEGAPSLAPHPDGRVVVYGWHESSYQNEPDIKSGFICKLDEAADMVWKVGEAIGAPEHLIVEACGDLPSQDETAGLVDLLDTISTEQLQAALARKQ